MQQHRPLRTGVSPDGTLSDGPRPRALRRVMEIAVVGLGPWGLCALERLVTGARQRGRRAAPTRVHVIEPGAPGSGVYGKTQPDYLLMNNPCGQLSMFPEHDLAGGPRYGVGFYEWAKAQGYRWVGDACRITRWGREITSHDFLPRRVMAEYLEWFYRALVAEAPPTLEIVFHNTGALDIVSQPGGHELVLLADGGTVRADHVILTCGHTANKGGQQGVVASSLINPYPVQRYVDGLPDEASVGVAGMGLVATDVVTALTVGRGGSFVDDGTRKRYVPSGREPVISLFSRSGLVYCTKSVSGVDHTGEYQPSICSPAVLAELRKGDSRRMLDIRDDLLPLIFAEMQLRFYSQSAYLAAGSDAAEQVRGRLTAAWRLGGFDALVAEYAGQYGTFDPAQHFFGDAGSRFASSQDYESKLYKLVEDDLDQSLMEGGSSPVKSAYEVFRIMRDGMRSVIEFRGVSLPSYLDFQENIRSRVNRLIAGPPALRSQQLLALMDAGVVRAPFGPSPKVEMDGSKFNIRCQALDRTYSEKVDFIIQGHLEDPTVHRSASPLLSRLYESGRLQQFRYGEVEVGSVELSEDFHPIDSRGEKAERIWVFGVLTEGIRYFNHYIPSPKSRIRAFLDVQTCIDAIAC